MSATSLFQSTCGLVSRSSTKHASVMCLLPRRNMRLKSRRWPLFHPMITRTSKTRKRIASSATTSKRSRRHSRSPCCPKCFAWRGALKSEQIPGSLTFSSRLVFSKHFPPGVYGLLGRCRPYCASVHSDWNRCPIADMNATQELDGHTFSACLARVSRVHTVGYSGVPFLIESQSYPVRTYFFALAGIGTNVGRSRWKPTTSCVRAGSIFCPSNHAPRSSSSPSPSCPSRLWARLDTSKQECFCLTAPTPPLATICFPEHESPRRQPVQVQAAPRTGWTAVLPVSSNVFMLRCRGCIHTTRV